ncbi:hypothetical protein WJX74_010141 [Apatococcus lobatus]|uniref:Uncharacterized protein n=1 Tax=Apatococcus lobatus TaxID=904363 RepID=A0AAW1PQN0_9CHLO
MLYRPERVLFSADHWVYSAEEQSVSLMRKYNQHSMEVQMENLEELKPLDFVHVLPGHRRRMSFKDKAAKDAAINLTIAAEKANLNEPGAGHPTPARPTFATSEASVGYGCHEPLEPIFVDNVTKHFKPFQKQQHAANDITIDVRLMLNQNKRLQRVRRFWT